MTINQIFSALSRGGKFSKPILLMIHHPDFEPLYLTNDNVSHEYNGHTYTASSFNYTRPKVTGGTIKNGSLEITGTNNPLYNLVDASNELFQVDIIATIYDGIISPFQIYHHQYGTVTIDEAQKINISFTNDDRLNMKFPPQVFDTDNNRGGA